MQSPEEQYRRALHYSDSKAFDPPDEIECPKCSGSMETDGYEIECNDCGYLIEPDYEAMMRDRYDDF